MLKSPRTLLFGLAAAACFLAIVAEFAYAQGRDEHADFLSQYEPAQKKVRDFYDNVKIAARYSVKGEETSWRLSVENDLVFMAAGPYLRVDSTRKRETKALAEGTIAHTVAGPYAFRLKKAPGAKEFGVNNLATNPKSLRQDIQGLWPAFFAPYSLLGTPIVEIFSQGQYQVKGLAQQTVGGTRLVKLQWTGSGKQSNLEGWFLFEIDHSWAVREYSWRSRRADFSRRCVVEYEGDANGIPLLKAVTYRNVSDGGDLLLQESYEITEIGGAQISESQFRLTAFGIAEPAHVAAPKSFWYLWFIGIAVASLGVGYFFWRRVWQRDRIAATNPAPAKPGA